MDSLTLLSYLKQLFYFVLFYFMLFKQRARLAVGSIFDMDIYNNNLEMIFSMDRDGVNNAALDWLFTNQLVGNNMTNDGRVLTISSEEISSHDPPVLETPDTKKSDDDEKVDNLPQPSAKKRVQSSFDRYCCICFMVRLYQNNYHSYNYECYYSDDGVGI